MMERIARVEDVAAKHQASLPANLGIIADDLSGANDAGLQFAKRGLRTVVLFERPTELPSADVVVLETDSRLAPAAEAAERVRLAARALLRLGVGSVYKKIDSTLRGNVGAEVDALLDELPAHGALVCPAFPSNGRTVVGGRLLLRGVPLEATEFALDPLWPARESNVGAVVARQSCRRVGAIGLEVVRQGWRAIAAEARHLRAAGVDVCVVDAETSADLACIAQVVPRSKGEWVAVGSAGLAEELPAALGLASAGPLRRPFPRAERVAATSPPSRVGKGAGGSGWPADAMGGHAVLTDGAPAETAEPVSVARRRPVLVVVGSVNPVARRQLEELMEGGGVLLAGLKAEVLLAGQPQANGEVDRAVEVALGALRAGGDAALSLETGDAGSELLAGAPSGLAGVESSARLAASLGRTAALLLQAGVEVAGLVMTGGATAKGVCQALGAHGVVVEREVLPGVPQGRLLGGAAAGLPVVTKAGGFGGPEALVEAVSFLRRT